jgi:hypothetical protein
MARAKSAATVQRSVIGSHHHASMAETPWLFAIGRAAGLLAMPRSSQCSPFATGGTGDIKPPDSLPLAYCPENPI